LIARPLGPIAPTSRASFDETAFAPSFRPYKAERNLSNDIYRFEYGWDADGNSPTFPYRERFRSPAEVEWAAAFDRLELPWEYEPLKFDMGPELHSYTPDFRVTGLTIPGSNRPLYIEIKWFGEDMDLTKYVLFTKWYNCDLLVLAHYDRELWKRAKRWKKRPRPNVLKPEKQRHYLILKCAQCDAYDYFPCDENTLEQRRLCDWRHASCIRQGKFVEQIVVPDDFLIQAGAIRTGRVVLPDGTSSARQISCIFP
jgi:hypothetical protein